MIDVMNRILILVLFLLAACADPWSPEGAVQFEPPAVYTEWWVEVEECSGISGELGRIIWYSVPRAISHPAGDDGITGSMWIAPHSIYIVAWELEIEWRVKHEMLHDLLQDGRHPPIFAECGVLSMPAVQ